MISEFSRYTISLLNLFLHYDKIRYIKLATHYENTPIQIY